MAMTEAQKLSLAKARETARQNRERRAAEAEAAAAAPADEEAEHFPPPAAAEGGVPEEAEPQPAISEPPVPTSGFERFLAALDDATRELLDDDDLREIYDQQQIKARAEKRASVKKAAGEKALLAARIDEGTVTPASAEQLTWEARMAEPVEMTVRLPTLGGIAPQGIQVGPVDVGLRIDQRIFFDGVRYPMTRAQYDSFRDIVYRSQQNELAFEGKNRTHWMRRLSLSNEAGMVSFDGMQG